MEEAVALIREGMVALSIREVLENNFDINDGSSGRTDKPEGDMTRWPMQEAQTKFSEFMDKVLAEGPQMITRSGAEVAVVMSADEFRKLTAPRQRLGDFLLDSPLRNSGVVFERE